MLFLTIIGVFICFCIPIILVLWLLDKYNLNSMIEPAAWITLLIEIVFFIQILRWMGEI